MKKKVINSIIGTLITLSGAQAQVGIGNADPHTGAILDLNNQQQKGLALAVLSAPVADTIGLVYFDVEDSVVKYFEGSIGYNGLSPWKYKYNGSISSDTYYQQGGNVGIGISTPLGKLSVANGSPVALNLTQGHLLIGTPDGSGTYSTFLSVDDDEIMAHDGTVVPVLNLQKSGGTVAVGGNITATDYNSNIDDPTTGINGPVPSGGIIMWRGAIVDIPDGWHLCDGAAGTPDLRERFVVGAGTANTTNPVDNSTPYANGANGGNNEVALTTGQLPPHSHTASCSTNGDHTHSYNDKTVSREDVNGSNFNNQGINGVPDPVRTTGTAGSHSHTITIDNTGSGQSHENRPPFFALAFIMKL
ncbi:hypothetical protein N9M27_00655 [Flavobacteriales bacterium]|nr:hypothetical protein [Flavobacteriales bacterium]